MENLDYDNVNIGKPLKQSEYSINPTARNLESALERYNRLRREVDELEKDLKVIEDECPDLELEQGNKASEISNQLKYLQNILDQCDKALGSKSTLPSSISSTSVVSKLLQEINHSDKADNQSVSKFTVLL